MKKFIFGLLLLLLSTPSLAAKPECSGVSDCFLKAAEIIADAISDATDAIINDNSGSGGGTSEPPQINIGITTGTVPTHNNFLTRTALCKSEFGDAARAANTVEFFIGVDNGLTIPLNPGAKKILIEVSSIVTVGGSGKLDAHSGLQAHNGIVTVFDDGLQVTQVNSPPYRVACAY